MKDSTSHGIARPRATTNTRTTDRSKSETELKHGRFASEISMYGAKSPRTSSPTFGQDVSEPFYKVEAKYDERPEDISALQFNRSRDSNDDDGTLDDLENVRPSSSGSKRGSTLPSRARYSTSLDAASLGHDLIYNSQEDLGVHTGLDLGNQFGSALSESENDQFPDAGVLFDDLVDRLLSLPKSKVDTNFTSIFLCLYRKFAAPSDLIVAIIHRFEELNDIDIPHVTRIASQLRYLNIIKQWVSDYPGDFARRQTRRIITTFVQRLAASQDLRGASREISPHLEIVCEDDDTEWAYSEEGRSRVNAMESFLTFSSTQSTDPILSADSPTPVINSSTGDALEDIETEKALTMRAKRISATPSSTSSISKSDGQSTGSSQTLLNVVASAQRQAQLLDPIPRNMLTKVQWHHFMEMPEDQIARELTRIDWIMYSSIQPRDLVRHVSLQANQKDKCRGLEHVNRMIHHFNHVAYWVTNIILLRDKPKHRAKALEKFMWVAWKLRYLNNYNSLGAVIAGINSAAVHRLSQTRELIPLEAQKQFMRLEILMGTQKGHFAYRLAYGNTTTSRIPFLPLHRRDLVLAEQGNRTFSNSEDGERINWKKFQIMGEVIISIRKSQSIGYPKINRNEEIQRLVLEGRFCKDEDVSAALCQLPSSFRMSLSVPRGIEISNYIPRKTLAKATDKVRRHYMNEVYELRHQRSKRPSREDSIGSNDDHCNDEYDYLNAACWILRNIV